MSTLNFEIVSAQTSYFFLKKQGFWTFENSNILIEKKPRNENHFLSWTKHIVEDLSKTLRLAAPNFQNCVCSNDLFWLNSNILGTGQYTLTNYLLEPFLSWFKIYEELCFDFFCIYVIAVLFCLFLFSSLQIWVISDFLDSSELYCAFDFNVLINLDGVLDRCDNLILNGNIYWRMVELYM